MPESRVRSEATLFRLPIAATPENGLTAASRLMVDKITTMARANLGRRIGRLADTDIVRLNRAIVVLLGLAGA